MPKTKRKFFRNKSSFEFREIVEGEKYAYVRKPLGNCNFMVELMDGTEMNNISVTGTIKKSYRINIDDLVLIEPTDDGSRGEYRICHKYSSKEALKLKNNGKLNSFAIADEKEDDYFGNDDDDEDFNIDDI